MERVAVLGAGSWGTALAKLLADQGLRTVLWARRTDQAAHIQQSRQNEAYLPGFELPDTLEATSELDRALDGAQMVVSVVPTHGLREVLERAAPLVPPGVPIVSATKGIENETLKLVSQIFEDHWPADAHGNLTYLGGPSFAREVAAGIPTAVSVAGRDPAVGNVVQHAFATQRFRVYYTEDVMGVELGGALKNVVAIAAGRSTPSNSPGGSDLGLAPRDRPCPALPGRCARELEDDDPLDARAVGGEHLLLDAAHGQHPAAQGDLAGHGHVVPDAHAGEQRHQRGHHGDPGARPVLGHGARRDVDVQVALLEEVLGDAELGGPAAHVAHGRLADSFMTSPSCPVS
jgi:NAD(P)-dependent dehydrogenase (short-subunit alcohol dehydrogenase family)